jgi:hypothetical protein
MFMLLEELFDGIKALVTSNNTIDNYFSRAKIPSTVYIQLSSSYLDTLFINPYSTKTVSAFYANIVLS